jgi:hypothetical protein
MSTNHSVGRSAATPKKDRHNPTLNHRRNKFRPRYQII